MTPSRLVARLHVPLLVFASAVTLVSGAVFAPHAYADSYDDRINALQQKTNQSQNTKSQLLMEATNLQGAVAAMDAEIAALQPEIDQSTAKSQKLQAEIDRIQSDLDKQKELQAQTIRKMFMADDMGMMEKLASSKNLSHYVDQEMYRVSVHEQIKQSTQRIQKLEKRVADDKADADRLLADQKNMQSQLNAQKAEKDRLLALNGEQRAAQDKAMQDNTATIAKLRKEQAAANDKGFVAIKTTASQRNGGYPDEWQNTPFPNTLVDPWGMYKRQCVSYTAFKVAQSGRHMPYWGGRGNAKLWDDNARAAGIPVDTKPRVGDVAVSNSGTYGHVMYVEAVHGDGTISISQYNAGWSGNYSEGRRSTAGLVFIHFP